LEAYAWSAWCLNVPAHSLEGASDRMPQRIGRPLVLLAEDNLDERDVLTQSLVMSGFEVVPVGTGVEAIELLRSVPADIIVMDMAMPEMDGAAAIRHIRHDLALVDVPVVAITGFAYDVHKPLSADVGADVFLLKPFAPDELVAVLVRLLR
jgi:CheY-like chemotaxis protein